MARNKDMVESIQHYWKSWENSQTWGIGYQPISPWSLNVYQHILKNAPERMKEHITTFYVDAVGAEYYLTKNN
jgi:hypothetical protein